MSVRILQGDCRATLATLPEASVQCCVTSPPYFGLRDYGHAGQIGLEPTPEDYVAQLVDVFRAVRRVLRDDGTLWLNLGDSYAGARGAPWGPSPSSTEARRMVPSRRRDDAQIPRSDIRVEGLKPKDLIGIPWRVAFALQSDGWWLRQDLIWHKPNPMPESVTDRCTKAHEYVFLLSKGPRYYFNAQAIAEPAGDKPAGNGFAGRQGGSRGLPMSGGQGTAERWQPGAPRKRASVPRGGFNGKTNQLRGREAFRAVTDMRNRRSVWSITTHPFPEAHFATMPPELAAVCIAAGSFVGGPPVLDAFGGAGTTGLVADRMQRDAILCELNPDYVALARRRISGESPLLAELEVTA